MHANFSGTDFLGRYHDFRFMLRVAGSKSANGWVVFFLFSSSDGECVQSVDLRCGVVGIALDSDLEVGFT